MSNREQLAEELRQAINTGGDYEIVRCAANLTDCDEQMRLANLPLPKISPYDRRFLHMGGDPAQVYQGDELAAYRLQKECEA